MIYGRFGDTITAIRPATADDVLRLDPPLDNEARVNLQAKAWYVTTHEDGTERISSLSYLRADGGFKEIMEAAGDSGWRCVYCDRPVPAGEQCDWPECRVAHRYARRRMGLR